MKVIIAGGRDFTNLMKLIETVQLWIKERGPITEVVSGGARGADRTGEAWARRNGVEIKRMPAEWDKYKNAAGPIRNRQMAEYADGLIAFWDGESHGTKNMIAEATKLKLPVVVTTYTPPISEFSGS